MIVINIILLVLVALLSFLLYINYKRANKAEEYCEAYVRFVSALYFKFIDTREKMKEIDRLGAFQADDEVGTTFRALDETIDTLYEFITKYVNNQTEEDKKA
jgi:regulator of sigma D